MPSKVRPSVRVTVTFAAFLTTCAFVSTSPSSLRITPLPCPASRRWPSGSRPGKRYPSSGWRSTRRSVSILTTAGPTDSTAAVTNDVFCRRVPRLGGGAAPSGCKPASGTRTSAGKPASEATGAASAGDAGSGTLMSSATTNTPIACIAVRAARARRWRAPPPPPWCRALAPPRRAPRSTADGATAALSPSFGGVPSSSSRGAGQLRACSGVAAATAAAAGSAGCELSWRRMGEGFGCLRCGGYNSKRCTNSRRHLQHLLEDTYNYN